jgi:serine/threonine protein kinase
MKELIGQTLGQYKIIEQVGQGGMATVFKAQQQGLGRFVAVKVLPPDYARQPGFSERFKREAQAIAQLEHPNILPVYDYGEQEQYTYLVMRYIENSRTLADVMRQPLSLKQSSDYLRQIANALDHAHGQGIIHRDIKPSNILLDKEWAFLADFGLARLIVGATQLTRTGAGMGTPAYMSPEQGAGAKVDGRTDVYAVGVIAYQMFTGQIPHQAETPHAIIYRRNHEPPPSLREVNPDIPQMVEQSVQVALSPLPDNRFQTTGAFIKALEQAIQTSGSNNVMTTVWETPNLPNVPSTGGSVAKPASQVSQRFCANCGAGLTASATFCNNCGTIATTSPSSSNQQTWLWAVVGGMVVLVLVLLAAGAFFAFSQTEDVKQTPIVVSSHDDEVTPSTNETNENKESSVDESEPQVENVQLKETDEKPAIENVETKDEPDEISSREEISDSSSAPGNIPGLQSLTSIDHEPLEDDFKGRDLDSATWVSILGDGEIQVSGGAVRLRSNGKTFPIIYPQTNPFPDGNFSLKLTMRYLDVTEMGVGFRLGEMLAEHGTSEDTNLDELYKGRIIEIWQDNNEWHISTGDDNAVEYSLSSPHLAITEIQIDYIQQVYRVLVDDEELYKSKRTDMRPTILWFGNPARVDAPGAWSSLEVSYISVEALPDDAKLTTPTPIPTSTPEPTPTQKPVPTTPTPIPLGQNCSSSAGGTFAHAWQNYRHIVGCPVSGQTTIPTIAEEAFQGGHMFWRSDTNQVYAVHDGNATQGSWQTDPAWNWGAAGEPGPDGIGLSPPPGLVEPKRGFGWVWRTFLGGTDSQLGWALDREYGFDNAGKSQYFEQGVMFKGSGSRIYVLVYGGQFYAQ